MTRLHDLGLITTLARRIGGARAGSAGHIYTLTPTGQRTLAIIQGQLRPPRTRSSTTLGTLFTDHTLAISDIYIQLITTSRPRNVTVSTFATEPECWWPTGHGHDLKPDAYCVLTTASHHDCWWLEVDQNTESLPRIRVKCRAYLDYLTHGGLGPHHVPPRILYTTPDTSRRDDIIKTIKALPTPENDLINVTTHGDAHAFLINELLAT